METSRALRFLEIKLLRAFKYNKEVPMREPVGIIHFHLISAEMEHNDDPTVNKLLSEIRELAYTTVEQVDNLESAFLDMSLLRRILSLLSFTCGCKQSDFRSQVKIIERNTNLIQSKYRSLRSRVWQRLEEGLRSPGSYDINNSAITNFQIAYHSYLANGHQL